jgi:hypothetical protein
MSEEPEYPIEIPEGHLGIRLHLVLPEDLARRIAPSLHTGSCLNAHTSFYRPTGVPAPADDLLNERGEEQAGG